MKALSIAAIVLNILWLLVVLFFVGTQGVEDYDIVGFLALLLIVVTPIVNIYALLRGQIPALRKDRATSDTIS